MRAAMTATRWLGPSELRVGLGCMRLSTDADRDETAGLATIAAAIAAGVTVFDTAHAYGRDAAEAGHNERLLGRALRDAALESTARIVTKCGMTRTDVGWVADGRARTIMADCETSLTALDGLGIDLLLIHAPDPRTPWRTTVRALGRLLEEGMVRRIGVSNVNRRQLDEALDLVDVAAVEVPLSIVDRNALRGGVVERCEDRGIGVIAHSPLGGPRRAGGLARNEVLRQIAAHHDVAPAEIAIAWLLSLSPTIVAIPGARRPETAVSSAHAATLVLDTTDRALLDAAFGQPGATAPVPRPAGGAEIVMVMGIPGAGKSRAAEAYTANGYRRLNRDERGGTLRDIVGALDHELSSGAGRFVLDNTYLTRATRSYVLETAARHGVPVRCVWIDTPLAQAQVNMVERLLDRFDALPAPAELLALSRREPGVLTPTSQMRTLRELEPPADDEGFAAIDRVPFARIPSERRNVGVYVAAEALSRSGWQSAIELADRSAPHLVFDWVPGGNTDALDEGVSRLTAEISERVEGAVCTHPGGQPACWCRPPLPGLPLAFARGHGIDPSRSILIGTSPAHRTLATTLGARYLAV
jgi:aryl-alcohol dehydrogenase-like predicted oxidoreductase/predicted kinase